MTVHVVNRGDRITSASTDMICGSGDGCPIAAGRPWSVTYPGSRTMAAIPDQPRAVEGWHEVGTGSARGACRTTRKRRMMAKSKTKTKAVAKVDRSRFAQYRDGKRGGPPRQLQPCGTVAAARRHQRKGEALCAACAPVWAAHQAAMYKNAKAAGKR